MSPEIKTSFEKVRSAKETAELCVEEGRIPDRSWSCHHLASSVLLAAGPPQSREELRGNDIVREP